METTDNELLRRYAKNGSQEAFSELVTRRLNVVHSAAMRQMGGDFHRAREITQQVFIMLAQKAAALSCHPSVVGWLYTSVFYKTSAMKRSERRRQSKLREATAMTEFSNPDPPADWSRLSSVLDAAMLELGARDRDAVLWRFFDGEPLAAIGGKLGLSEDAARKRLERALERMRRSLRRQGLKSTTAALANILGENAVVAAPAGLAESVISRTLATVASVGTTPGVLRRLLRHGRASARIHAALWTSGILSLGATTAAGLELWTAHREQVNLSADEQAYRGDQDQLRTQAAGLSRRSMAKPDSSPSAGIAHRGSRADFQAFLRDYPQTREILLAANRDFARQLYGSFFRNAALSPAQIGKMEDAMAERCIQGEVLSPNTFAIEDECTLPEDQLLKLLGEEGCRQFLAYQQSAFAHRWALVAASWVPGELALSADQTDQLAHVLDRAAGKSLGGEASLATLDWGAVRSQVKAKLPAAQWDAISPALERLRAESVQRSVMVSFSNSNLP